jgi:hypothetical protein
MTDCKFEYKPQYLVFPESKWTCYMFGNRPGGMGMSYTPQKGEVPNRFVRFMMRICFDCYWVKKDD